MRPAGVVVHAGGANLPGLQAQVEDVHGVLVLVELSVVDILDEDHSRLRVFPDLELIRRMVPGRLLAAIWPEQVEQLVQVELHHVAREAHSEVIVPLESLFDIEHFLEAARHDSWVASCACDRVGLARARLPVREDAHVVAVDGTLDQHLRVLEYGLLVCALVKAGVKLEFLKLVLGCAAIILTVRVE